MYCIRPPKRNQLTSFMLLLFLCLVVPKTGFSETDKKFGGVGLQVVPTSQGELVVLAVVENSPAEKEGMRPGDLIVAVDGVSLQGTDFTEVVRRYLWGPVGSRSLITFQRPGSEGTRQVDIERTPLPAASADQVSPEVRMLAPEAQMDSEE